VVRHRSALRCAPVIPKAASDAAVRDLGWRIAASPQGELLVLVPLDLIAIALAP
jgi:hypothetical protein